ncbi:MAG: hypothetical protein WA476_05380 [Acidobacteriaceae bacterium]
MTADHINDPMASDPHITAIIDATLRSVGSATPAAGLEGRILTHIASERIKLEAAPAHRPVWACFGQLHPFPARALGLVTACLLGFIIVAGSVAHSRRIKPGQVVAPPVLVLPSNGIGAASAVHPAAPASAPVPAGQSSRGRSAPRSGPGRARIAPHSRKAPGVAVPAPSSNDPQN